MRKYSCPKEVYAILHRNDLGSFIFPSRATMFLLRVPQVVLILRTTARSPQTIRHQNLIDNTMIIVTTCLNQCFNSTLESPIHQTLTLLKLFEWSPELSLKS
uniref:Uncharacterized protein n=1 Tax=Physcomitrium patens TaxID=3218 RepID=A0A2K1KQP0_PHYPA|nr:hypothetical protein PHYPA_006982 [Physcomitrium patens]